jgi:hypothetical protein
VELPYPHRSAVHSLAARKQRHERRGSCSCERTRQLGQTLMPILGEVGIDPGEPGSTSGGRPARCPFFRSTTTRQECLPVERLRERRGAPNARVHPGGRLAMHGELRNRTCGLARGFAVQRAGRARIDSRAPFSGDHSQTFARAWRAFALEVDRRSVGCDSDVFKAAVVAGAFARLSFARLNDASGMACSGVHRKDKGPRHARVINPFQEECDVVPVDPHGAGCEGQRPIGDDRAEGAKGRAEPCWEPAAVERATAGKHPHLAGFREGPSAGPRTQGSRRVPSSGAGRRRRPRGERQGARRSKACERRACSSGASNPVVIGKDAHPLGGLCASEQDGGVCQEGRTLVAA